MIVQFWDNISQKSDNFVKIKINTFPQPVIIICHKPQDFHQSILGIVLFNILMILIIVFWFGIEI